MDKKDFWPKEGKLKKGLIILVVVVAAALLITLLEEKIGTKVTKRLPFAVAIACIAIWLHKPDTEKK